MRAGKGGVSLINFLKMGISIDFNGFLMLSLDSN